MDASQQTERFTVFIPHEISTEIRVEAARQRATISAVATQAIRQYLDRKKEEVVA